MLRSTLLASALLLLVNTACEPSADTVECVDPPEAALGVDSDFEFAIEPYPVTAGTAATITVDGDGLANGLSGGLGASWECWDGEAWLQTHIIVRSSNGLPAAVIDLSTDPTVPIPDIGLPVPHSHQIVIPPVDPGTYRITDYLFGLETTLTAHRIVEVVASQE